MPIKVKWKKYKYGWGFRHNGFKGQLIHDGIAWGGRVSFPGGGYAIFGGYNLTKVKKEAAWWVKSTIEIRGQQLFLKQVNMK